MISTLREEVERTCRDVLAPLVRADGGRMHLVLVTPDAIHIHLSGTCAGCPGAAMTQEYMIEPAIFKVAPSAKLQVTTGFRVPEGSVEL